MSAGKHIDEQLRKIEDELYVLVSVKRRHDIVLGEIRSVENQLLIQRKKMNEELQDVIELEKKGVKAIFSKILGNIEQQLENERQEYLHEVLSYNSLVDELETLQFEARVLKEKIDKNADLEVQYKALSKEKERQILLSYPKHAKELRLMDNQVAVYEQLQKECIEALYSGEDLLKLLKHITGQLQHVKQWGVYKSKTYAKNKYIDKAQQFIGAAQVKFNIFEKELRDIFPDFDLNLDSYHVRSFINNFYDGLITDWIVLKQLQVAIQSTIAATHKVARLNAMVNQELSKAQDRAKEIKNKRQQFLSNISLS